METETGRKWQRYWATAGVDWGIRILVFGIGATIIGVIFFFKEPEFISTGINILLIIIGLLFIIVGIAQTRHYWKGL